MHLNPSCEEQLSSIVTRGNVSLQYSIRLAQKKANIVWPTTVIWEEFAWQIIWSRNVGEPSSSDQEIFEF